MRESTVYLEVQEAKLAAENAYALWGIADPTHEEERWFAYQAAMSRYNALVVEAKRRQESRKFTLPWLAS